MKPNNWNQKQLDNQNYWNEQDLAMQNQESARSWAMQQMAKGILPDDETLTAAGISKQAAQQQVALALGDIGGGSAQTVVKRAASPVKSTSGGSGTSVTRNNGGSSMAQATTAGAPTFSQLKQTVSGLVQTNSVEKVLPYLDKYWGSMSANQQQEIQAVLARAGVQYTPS